jgi:hypothetical protein
LSGRYVRRFYLERDRDVSGVSGTGRVTDGVPWPDGSCRGRRGCGGHLDQGDLADRGTTARGQDALKRMQYRSSLLDAFVAHAGLTVTSGPP